MTEDRQRMAEAEVASARVLFIVMSSEVETSLTVVWNSKRFLDYAFASLGMTRDRRRRRK
ncbi:MAG: hypothetical protein QOI96_1648 [Verrucomicrobiota bacterium]